MLKLYAPSVAYVLRLIAFEWDRSCKTALDQLADYRLHYSAARGNSGACRVARACVRR